MSFGKIYCPACGNPEEYHKMTSVYRRNFWNKVVHMIIGNRPDDVCTTSKKRLKKIITRRQD